MLDIIHKSLLHLQSLFGIYVQSRNAQRDKRLLGTNLLHLFNRSRSR